MFFLQRVLRFNIILIVILLLISCDNGITNSCTDNCTYVGEFRCSEDNSAILICEKQTNGCFEMIPLNCEDSKVCSNGNCEYQCDEECGANEICIKKDEINSCECNTNFHRENGNICFSDMKTINCKDISPTNAESIFVDVIITWNKDNKSWNEAETCKWECKSGYHLVKEDCLSDINLVACDSSHIPINSVAEIIDVEVKWNDETNKWSDPENCKWHCDTGHQDNDNNSTCTDNCNNTICGENQICDDSSGTATCSCKTGYQDNDTNSTCKETCETAMDNGIINCNAESCNDSSGVAICNYISGCTLKNTHLYCRIRKNWDDAEGVCKEYNMHLVTINDGDENAEIKNEIGETWIGLNDQENESDSGTSNNWKWADGTSNAALDTPYWNWNGGQPNNDGNEDCVIIRSDNGKWSDKGCNASYQFVCE